jgi:S-DNA-T family DNA segregation ATPase FtsK/SpoIIIE
MAELKDDKRRKKNKDPLHTETVLAMLSVLTLIFALLIALGATHLGGKGGEIIFKGFYALFGIYAFATPFLFLTLTYYLWKEELPELPLFKTIGVFFLLLGTAIVMDVSSDTHPAGLLGQILAGPLLAYFSPFFALSIGIAVIVIGSLITLNRKPDFSALMQGFSYLSHLIPSFSFLRKKTKKPEMIVQEDQVEEPLEFTLLEEDDTERVGKEDSNVRGELFRTLHVEEEIAPLKKEKKEEKQKQILLTPEFAPPPLDLLNVDSGKSGAGDSKAKMSTIQRTLEHFKIRVEMGEVTVGPTVTQFTLKPAQGVNLSKISALHDNLSMELGAEFLRIEAPIPGKTLVGIEIPNEKKSILGLRSMLELEQFDDGGSLTLAIGKSIVGKPVFADLAKMPHLLVAGATRTGKSVTLQNLLVSLLYKNSPYDLKLIILDPKRVEFTAYNNMPHLYTPIIKEPKGAIKALSWAIQEMERRYEVLADNGQVNVDDYNKKILAPALEKARKKLKETGEQPKNLPPKLPYIVIIFDEYNDFMLSYPKEISPLITSLTQKGRAAGVHLILATQRPDVKVITGTIKANIPARIALKTTSQIDSRTILDSAGAEDLLGNGDMLYMASDNPRLVRLQAPFISTEEIRSVVAHIKESYLDFIPDHIDITKIKIQPVSISGDMENDQEGSDVEPTDDEDYLSAKDYVLSTGKASTSSLQTAFRWGYNKAARIMNDLERFGTIGPARPGERYREIMGTKEEAGGVEMKNNDDPIDALFSEEK